MIKLLQFLIWLMFKARTYNVERGKAKTLRASFKKFCVETDTVSLQSVIKGSNFAVFYQLCKIAVQDW